MTVSVSASSVVRAPVTVADFLAMGETEGAWWEVQEGSLVMSPTPVPRHMNAGFQLCRQLDDQLPASVKMVPEVDLNLQLAPDDGPATVRIPDVVVVDRAEYDRVNREGGLLRASSARLVVEILSPGSVRTDRIIKLTEYADAGIPHYWIVSLHPAVELTALTLADGTYSAAEPVRGVYEGEPFGLRVDLDALTD